MDITATDACHFGQRMKEVPKIASKDQILQSIGEQILAVLVSQIKERCGATTPATGVDTKVAKSVDEARSPGIAEYRAATDFELAECSGVQVISQDRVGSTKEHGTQAPIPVPLMFFFTVGASAKDGFLRQFHREQCVPFRE